MDLLFSLFAIPSYSLGFAWLIYLISFILFLRLLFFKSKHINRTVIPFFLVCCALSIYIFLTNNDLVLSFNISRYYLGLGFFVLVFSSIRLNSLLFIRSLYCFSLLEFFYVKFLGRFPPYVLRYFDNNIHQVYSRAEFSESLTRLFGPALNSSVSSSIFAVLLLLYCRQLLFDEPHPIFDKIKVYDIILISFVFVCTGSTVGFLTLAVGLLIYIIRILIVVQSRFKLKKTFFLLTFSILSGFVIFISTQFGQSILVSKLSYSYFTFVLADKISTFFQSYVGVSGFFFGLPFYSADPTFLLGGDFLLLKFIIVFGFIPSLAFFLSLFSIAKQLRIQLPIFLLVLSTIHYGTIFNLVGQFFVSILISMSVPTRRL